MLIKIKSSILGLVTLILSSSLFAFPACPPVNGYRLIGHDANNGHCTYTKVVIGAMQNPKLCLKAFMLTDPHYKIDGCKYDRINNHCVCHIHRI